MNKVLLVDHSALLHRSVFAYADLSYQDQPTGGLYGYVTQLARVIAELEPDLVVAFGDAKPYFRALAFPDYKADRRQDMAEDLAEQFTAAFWMTKQYLRIAGIPLITFRGLEADDLIANYVKQEQASDSHCYVFSNDTDLNQLLEYPHVTLVRKKQKEKEYNFYTRKSFAADFPGIEPVDYVWVDALSGGHNNLKGIRGIGPVKAYKIVAAWKQGGVHPLKYSNGQYADQTKLNHLLTILPHPFADALDIMVYQPRESNYRAVFKFLANYGISMTSAMKNAIE